MSINGDFVEFLDEAALVPVQVTPEVSIELAEDVFFMAGPSAYQVWLDEGNVGTKDDFLQDIVEFVVPGRLATNAMLITNWNTTIENGWYKANGTATGTPVVAGMFGTVERFDQYVTQTLYRVVADSSVDTMIYRRTSNDTGANWEDWYRVRWSEAELDLRYSPKIGSNGSTVTNNWIKDRRNVLNWSPGAVLNVTGEIVIQTNIGAVINKMVMLRIRGQYHALQEGIIDLAVRTYFNGTPGTTNNSAAVNYGNLKIPNIRFLRRNSDGLLAIALSPDASQANWDYPQLSVDAQIAYGGVSADTVFDNWSASITTDTSDYTELSTLVPNQAAFTGDAEPLVDTQLPARLRIAAADVTDWNTVIEAGFHRNTASPAANTPTPTGFFYGIVVRSSNRIQQTVWNITKNSTDTGKWQRESADTGATWSAWYRLRESEIELDAKYLPRANHTGTQPASTISDFTEAAQDAIAALLTSGTQVSLTYNDAANTLQITATGADAETMRDTIGAALVGTGNVSVVVNDAADTITFSITGVIPDANLPARIQLGGANVTNWNLITEAGFYRNASASSLNAPDAGYFYGTVLKSGGYILQTLFDLNNHVNDSIEWQRKSVDGGATWGAWYRLRGTQGELDARYAPYSVDGINLPIRLRGLHGATDLAGGDWNNATESGWYAVDTAGVNIPEPSLWTIGMVVAHITTWVTQTVWCFTADSSSDTKMWRRERNNGVWGSWYRVRQSEEELDARYMNVGERATNNELRTTLGTFGVVVADANNATLNGWYRFTNTTANCPSASFWLCHVQADLDPALYVTQTAHEYGLDFSGDTKTWRREMNNGVWGSWYKVRQSESELDRRYEVGPLYSKIQSYTVFGGVTTVSEATAGPYTKDGTTYDQVMARTATATATNSGLRALGVDRNGVWTRSFWYKRRGATDSAFNVDINDAYEVGQSSTVANFVATANWQRAVVRVEVNNTSGALRFSDINFLGAADIYIFEDSLTFGAQPAIPDTGWLEIGAGVGAGAFQNGWVNHAGAGEATVAYRKIGNRVHLKGMAKNGTLGAIAFQLAVGFRPPSNMHLITASNGAASYLTISTGGDVSLNGSATWVSLAGISFLVD